MRHSFITNIAEFLDHPTTVPMLYDVEVECVSGMVNMVKMCRCAAINIKNMEAAMNFIDAAAVNNWTSLISEPCQTQS